MSSRVRGIRSRAVWQCRDGVALQATIHNAALDSSLIHLRAFNEFLQPGRRSDDVRGHHYPNCTLSSFLTDAEEREINKYLAHLTLTRTDVVTKPWLLDDMVIRALGRGIGFLSFIESGFPLSNEHATAELRGVREVARRLIPKISSRSAATDGAS